MQVKNLFKIMSYFFILKRKGSNAIEEEEIKRKG